VAAPRTVNSPNPSLLINLAAAVLLAFGVAPSQAQSWRSREAVYSAQTVDGVPLQPFCSIDNLRARKQSRSPITRHDRLAVWNRSTLTNTVRKRRHPDSMSAVRVRWSPEIARCCGTESPTRRRTRPTRSNMQSGRSTQSAIARTFGAGDTDRFTITVTIVPARFRSRSGISMAATPGVFKRGIRPGCKPTLSQPT